MAVYLYILRYTRGIIHSLSARLLTGNDNLNEVKMKVCNDDVTFVLAQLDYPIIII